MSDKELADKVVALGVISHRAGYYFTSAFKGGWTAEQIIRDWRVAGALMERCNNVDIDISFGAKHWHIYIIGDTVLNESLPRAIIEACVEALS